MGHFSINGACCKLLFLLICITCFKFMNVLSVKFEVGGDTKWTLPDNKDDDQMYNTWASKNRFNVNDTLHFTYEKDSVLEVTEDEYEKCLSSHPLFFSNNGDTKYTFDRPGFFYFISGISGHCERGQKLIIKVLDPENPPSPKTPACGKCVHGGSSGRDRGRVVFSTVVLFITFVGLNFF